MWRPCPIMSSLFMSFRFMCFDLFRNAIAAGGGRRKGHIMSFVSCHVNSFPVFWMRTTWSYVILCLFFVFCFRNAITEGSGRCGHVMTVYVL